MSKMSYSDYLEKILAATGGTVYWLDQNCVYQGCNDNAAKMVGLTSGKDVRGLTDHDMLRFGNWGVEQANAFARDTREVIQTKQAKHNVEEPVIFDLAGNPIYFLTTRMPIFDDEDQVIGVVGTSTNITALKKIEQSLVIAKQQAEAAHQAKTEFLASMSHDVKTPLSGVIAIVELLTSQLQNPKDQELIENIGRCGKQLMSFFENCIELSKMEMTQLQEINQTFSMAKIIESIHTLFVPSATAKQLIFNTYLDPKLPTILLGNQINIYRVILNLIGNAIKFTKIGEVNLKIVLDKKIDDENIFVKIVVQDTGIGIPKDKQKIIFEKLQRLTPSYYNRQEGYGIGLYIVDQYVKAMQGTIDVDSAEGMGSKFIVTLPLKIVSSEEIKIVMPPILTVAEVPMASVPEPAPQPLISIRDVQVKEDVPRILLVEDNHLIQAVTKEILHTAGAHVDVASCGKEAIDLFAPNKYALIYMDIGLPDIEGNIVSQHLRAMEAQKNSPQTPIIALTAHATGDFRTICNNSGMQGVLSKPLSGQQARQILEFYVEKKSVLVDGLQFLEATEKDIIDMVGCVALVGSEARAKEILKMMIGSLDNEFIPEISKNYENNNDVELCKVLHKFLGGMCYISAPALKQATLNFQKAMKEKLAIREQAYQNFLTQIQMFKKACDELTKKESL